MSGMGAGDQETRLVLGPESQAGAVVMAALGVWHDAYCRRPGSMTLPEASQQLAGTWVALGRICGAIDGGDAPDAEKVAEAKP